MFTNLPSTDPIECTIRVYVVLVGCNHDMCKMTWTREITPFFILIVITIIFSSGYRATAARSERIGKLYHKIIYLVLTQLVPQVDCKVFLRTFLFAFDTRRTQPNFGVSVLPSGDIFPRTNLPLSVQKKKFSGFIFLCFIDVLLKICSIFLSRPSRLAKKIMTCLPALLQYCVKEMNSNFRFRGKKSKNFAKIWNFASSCYFLLLTFQFRFRKFQLQNKLDKWMNEWINK